VHDVSVFSVYFQVDSDGPALILRLTSPEGTNRLTRASVQALTVAIAELNDELKDPPRPLIIAAIPNFSRSAPI
jgi:hypothetical protein